MITNKGNQIIAKYLLGQAPEFAAYLAVGVGARPLLLADNQTASPTKKSLDFEAFRTPVLSRGIVNDTVTIALTQFTMTTTTAGSLTTSTNNGVGIGDEFTVAFTHASMTAYNSVTFTATSTSGTTVHFTATPAAATVTWTPATLNLGNLVYVRDRLVFKAQLPPDQRYEMTEVAIFPAANNQLALGYDSRSIAGFLTTEGWNYHDVSDQPISFTTQSMADGIGSVSASVVGDAVFINSNNQIFSYADRENKYESPRYLSRCLVVPGNMSPFVDDSMATDPATYVTTSEIPINLSKNSPNDVVKLALSVVGSDAVSVDPDRVRIRIEFGDTVGGGTAYANHIIYAGDMSGNRYQIVSKELRDFSLTGNFSWARVNKVSIYAESLNAGSTWDGSYIVLDGLRLDNENTLNPLYGMVAYSVLKNQYEDGLPLEKVENSQGYMEYRMGVSIY